MLQHLVLVRHGESEGDVRRAAWRRGEPYVSLRRPEDEELTERGVAQSLLAGRWIAEHIMRRYGIEYFDGCYVSSSLRSEQSAVAMELEAAAWQDDDCLDERNRGVIRGLRPQQHEQLFPGSYRQMKTDPILWIPPRGESLQAVGTRAGKFLENIEGQHTVIAVTHRDWIWAAQQPLEALSDEAFLAVDTDAIHNAQIIHYTSIDPDSGRQAPTLMWKRSVDPAQPQVRTEWQSLPGVAARFAAPGQHE